MYLSPKRVRAGSKVAVVAPASPFKSDELAAGLDVIREAGLDPVLGPCVRSLRTANIHAAPLNERVDELHWAFGDPRFSAVIPVTGGMGSAGVLPYLDYDMIRRSRKALVGMSDITALNTGILNGAGLISINGQSPSIRLDKGPFLERSDSESLAFTLQLMMSDAPWGSRPFQINQYIPRTVSSGRASGFVIGGNMDTFVHLLGTPYFPESRGAIMFIEDVHKGGEVIAREVLHLKLAGVLNDLAGVVVGEFQDVKKRTDDRSPAIEDVLQEYFSSGPPCSYGYSFSHGPYTIPIPIGSQCTLDADSGAVSFDFRMA